MDCPLGPSGGSILEDPALPLACLYFTLEPVCCPLGCTAMLLYAMSSSGSWSNWTVTLSTSPQPRNRSRQASISMWWMHGGQWRESDSSMMKQRAVNRCNFVGGWPRACTHGQPGHGGMLAARALVGARWSDEVLSSRPFCSSGHTWVWRWAQGIICFAD